VRRSTIDLCESKGRLLPGGLSALGGLAAALFLAGWLAPSVIGADKKAKLKVPGVPIKDKPADNSTCIVCHMDFSGETFTAAHEKEGIGCVQCHGASVPHSTDETLCTKPDILYGRLQVKPFCRTCHKAHKKPDAVEAFRQKWHGRARPNGRFIGDDAICTDCHGEHTIPPEK